eukprot:8229188-Pyramimonas_sp.AAC.1
MGNVHVGVTLFSRHPTSQVACELVRPLSGPFRLAQGCWLRSAARFGDLALDLLALDLWTWLVSACI